MRRGDDDGAAADVRRPAQIEQTFISTFFEGFVKRFPDRNIIYIIYFSFYFIRRRRAHEDVYIRKITKYRKRFYSNPTTSAHHSFKL